MSKKKKKMKLLKALVAGLTKNVIKKITTKE